MAYGGPINSHCIEETVTRPLCMYYFGCMDMYYKKKRPFDCTGCQNYLKTHSM